MPVTVGTRLGPYEVLGLIGAGGMGEVYKARDTRLDRTVAIKVLPSEISADPDRRARFEREAKTIAGVSHPHICTLYDVGVHEDSAFLVMEHLEGEALSDRLQKGRLPIESALTIAAEIAVALSAAHRQGIIHRDLKPGNVMLTKSGAKLLDFGLAKLTQPGPHRALVVSAATQSAPLTGHGVIVGTLQYMAPEQIEGKPADARGDLWALGTILYEMLTGRRAFEGTTAASLIGNIMTAQPPALTTLQPLASPALDRLVRKCLAKDPDVRWESAADLADDLRWQRETLPGDKVAGAVRPTSKSLSALLVAAGLILIGTGAGVMWLLRPASTPAGVVTTTIKLEPGYWLDGFRRPEDLERPSRTAIAISPDGRSVVYSASVPRGEPRLFLRSLDRSEARPLAGTERAIAPFFSPDGRWLGFWADRQLKKIPVEGGLATPLCNLESSFGASWGVDDIILVASAADGGLAVVPADGGQLERWTTPDKNRDEASHRLPHWLPDGRGALFTVMRHGYDAHPSVALLRRDKREWRVLIEDAADARYVASGHLLFLRQGALMGVRFDLRRQEIVGRPVVVIDGVMQAFAPNFSFNTGAGQFAVSQSGSVVYALGGVAPDTSNSLVWVDLEGHERPAAPLQFPFFAPRLSPDGERIVYILYGQERHLWVYDLVRGTNTRVHDQGLSSFPTWAPDGKHLLFGWQKSVRINLFQQPADGSAAMERITTSDCDQRVGSWSPDGEKVALVELCEGSGWNISLLDVRSRQVTPLITSNSTERFPELSPDGRWIAYSSDETKRDEVYVQRVLGSGRFQVSTAGGIQPLWSKDGTRLFYRWLNQVWVADVRLDSGLAPGTPRLLFEREGYSLGSPIRGYDLSPDSQRFLMVKLDRRSPSPATEITLVQNWLEDLKSKLPAGK